MTDRPSVWSNGVPMSGPMAEYVMAAMDKVGKEAFDEMHRTGITDLKGNKQKVKAAMELAIAEWKAKEAGLK